MTIIPALLAAALSTAPSQTVVQGAQPPAQIPVQGTPSQPRPGMLPARDQQPKGTPFGRPAETVMSSLQGFNIVLLVGESVSSGASIEDVPAAARKALADMKDFLPFKHYRVLDSQWTSCCADSGRKTIAGRVQGLTAGGAPSGADLRLVPRTYNFILQVGSTASRLSVYFSLQPEGAARSGQNEVVNAARQQELEKRLFDLRREQDRLEVEIPRRAKSLNDNHPDVQALQAERRRVQQRVVETVNEISRASAHGDTERNTRALIDSNFMMDVGETVVVGTSRLGGDKALIAIVTAARKGAR